MTCWTDCFLSLAHFLGILILFVKSSTPDMRFISINPLPQKAQACKFYSLRREHNNRLILISFFMAIILKWRGKSQIIIPQSYPKLISIHANEYNNGTFYSKIAKVHNDKFKVEHLIGALVKILYQLVWIFDPGFMNFTIYAIFFLFWWCPLFLVCHM